MPPAEQYLKPEVIRTVARFIVEGFLTGRHARPLQGFRVESSAHRRYYTGGGLRSLKPRCWCQ
jgi:hypothetical protein